MANISNKNGFANTMSTYKTAPKGSGSIFVRNIGHNFKQLGKRKHAARFKAIEVLL